METLSSALIGTGIGLCVGCAFVICMRQVKKAIENNINPEEYSTNPIDDLLRYDEYLREHGRDIKDSDSWKDLMS